MNLSRNFKVKKLTLFGLVDPRNPGIFFVENLKLYQMILISFHFIFLTKCATKVSSIFWNVQIEWDRYHPTELWIFFTNRWFATPSSDPPLQSNENCRFTRTVLCCFSPKNAIWDSGNWTWHGKMPLGTFFYVEVCLGILEAGPDMGKCP